MVDASVIEATENEWWSDWRSENYSWRGLEDIRLYGWYFWDGKLVDARSAPDGAVPATLQHYWWDQKEHLVSGDGEEWTMAHVPMRWRDGTPAKADWSLEQRSKLQEIIRQRLKAARKVAETEGDRASPLAAQLRGCILHGLVELEGAQINANRACFDARVDLWRLASGSTFERALFKKDVSIRGADADGQINFYGSRFLGDLEIKDFAITGGTKLNSAVIVGDLTFLDGKLGASLECQHTIFYKKATFVRLNIEGSVNFERAQFEDDATFSWSKFHDLARWEFCQFKGKVDFQRNDFYGVFSAYDAKFSRGAVFVHTLFTKRARFTKVNFGTQAGDTIDFSCARFIDLADFAEVTFPDEQERFSGAFRGALFDRVADFQTKSATWIAALDGAMLTGKLLLDPPDEIAANREFHAAMMKGVESAAKAAAEAKKSETISAGGKVKGGEVREWQAAALENELKQLEGGCRVVKLAMGRDRNEMLEQRYYRFQLIARRRQKTTPGWEKIFSHLYSLTSDYGTSMVKPFAALAFCLALFTAGYLGLGLALDGVAPSDAVGVLVADAWSAASFSWNNTFRPLSALSLDVVRQGDGSWLAAMLYDFGAGPSFGIRVLATLQSLLAIILAFLFALAVRRRFQIG